MKIITVLLCVLANRATSQTSGTFPAKILAQQKTISENSNLYVTCSTFGVKRDTLVYVYLCKDGCGISRKELTQDKTDITFTISRVGLDHSGNYSCVYSIQEFYYSEVAGRGKNIIQILVIANFVPADISVAGPSTVSEGDDVEFRCTVSHALQTHGECELIHSYLKRNESLLQVQAFNVTRMEASFSIEGATMRDSGHYSCVVLPSKCIQEHEKTISGNNSVLLEVKVSLVLRVMVSCGVTTLILSLGLCLWWITNIQGHMVGVKSKDMLEEQQEQTEREDLEAQDGESFSMEGEEEYPNDLVSDECEGVYSVPDETDYDDCNGEMCAN